MHTPDPSWCARINAWKREPEPAPAPASFVEPSAEAVADVETPPSASPFRPREIPSTHVCEMCGTVMFDHNCKIICPNCGYKRDCSDP
ncbi:MAG TPA: hypothetical protein VFQ39_15005 [Longimicrobium sp.]|nr:hypothetical protein [Longimicrobium sp.]